MLDINTAGRELPFTVADGVLLNQPNLRLFGPIGPQTFWDFISAMSDIRANGEHLILEITSEGGDADTARRIALEIELFLRDSDKQAYVIGKTIIYSAAITILAAVPVSNRFLTPDAILLVHERRMGKSISLDGPMRANIQILQEQLSTLLVAQKLEQAGFARLVEGSRLSLGDLEKRAAENYYLDAAEAVELGIISQIL
jgi:ATP-dependent protease ClpP protease subunit